MSKKAFIVIGIQGGDEGKGGVVHKLCLASGSHTVIKVGGAQGSHGVKTSKGQSFAFSQFGCGTFEGVETYISPNFILDPNGILNEGNALKYGHGIHNVFDLIKVDERALCNTPLHRISSRLRELALKNDHRGTVGTGVGRAYLDAELYPHLAVYAGDILLEGLNEKIEAVRKQKVKELQYVIDSFNDLLEEDKKEAAEMIRKLQDPGFSIWIADRFREMATIVKIVPATYLEEVILKKDGHIVIESSHGVLNDKYLGFHPHTTKLRVLPKFSIELLQNAGYDGEILTIGVTRSYAIRHGAGHLVTENPAMVETLLPGSNKETNRYQGKVRVGTMDFVALRYAIEACGGPENLFGIALTWFDQNRAIGTWSTCNRYCHPENPEYFDEGGNMIVQHQESEEQFTRQQRFGQLLDRCKPVVDSLDIGAEISIPDLTTLCAQVVYEKTKVPVRMISFGPTEEDKVLL